MYDQGKMRRFVSIALIVLCWLAPACALLPGSSDAPLPACCRRHGAHHCTMGQAGYVPASASAHQIAAPTHCPLYHASSPAARGAFTLASLPGIQHSAESTIVVATRVRAAFHQARTTASRGPPSIA